MKKLLFVVILVFLAMSAFCQEERAQKLELYRGIVRGNVAKAKAAESPILIFEYKVESPNSAGGVDATIEYINITDKRLKYVYFTVVPYNSVDDKAYSSIGGESEVTLEDIGYIDPVTNNYEEFIYEYGGWGNVWYNHAIRYMKITKIEVVFEDNSRTSITGNAINAAIFQSEIELDKDFWLIKRSGK